jgi:hypothetical protein
MNALAFQLMREATGLEPKQRPTPDPVLTGHAADGSKGGKVRAKRLSAAKRSAIAKKAARARWNR